MLIEQPICACTLPMIELRNSGVFGCTNCDFVQPQEIKTTPNGEPYARIRTPQDISYHLEWERRKKTIYPGD